MRIVLNTLIYQILEIEPGSVMVIEQVGKLKECDLPYDKRLVVLFQVQVTISLDLYWINENLLKIEA
jgi:hypothetical protein